MPSLKSIGIIVILSVLLVTLSISLLIHLSNFKRRPYPEVTVPEPLPLHNALAFKKLTSNLNRKKVEKLKDLAYKSNSWLKSRVWYDISFIALGDRKIKKALTMLEKSLHADINNEKARYNWELLRAILREKKGKKRGKGKKKGKQSEESLRKKKSKGNKSENEGKGW